MEECKDYSMAYPNSESIVSPQITAMPLQSSSSPAQLSQLQQNEALRYGLWRPSAMTINTQPRAFPTYQPCQAQQQPLIADDTLIRTSLQYTTVPGDLSNNGGNVRFTPPASDRLSLAQQLQLPLQMGYSPSYTVRLHNEPITTTDASLLATSEPILATLNGQQRTAYESWPWTQRTEIDARTGLAAVQPAYDCSIIAPKQEPTSFVNTDNYNLGRRVQSPLQTWSPFVPSGPRTLFVDALKMRSQQLPTKITEPAPTCALATSVCLKKRDINTNGQITTILQSESKRRMISPPIQATGLESDATGKKKITTPFALKNNSKILASDTTNASLSHLIERRFTGSHDKKKKDADLTQRSEFLHMDEICTRLKSLLADEKSFYNVTDLARILKAHRKRVYAAVGTLEHCNILTKEQLDGMQAFVYHGRKNVIDEQSVMNELSRLETSLEGIMTTKYQTLFVLKEVKEKPQSVREIYDKLRLKYEHSFSDTSSVNKTVRRRLYDITKVLDVFEVFTKQGAPRTRAARFEWSLGAEGIDSLHN